MENALEFIVTHLFYCRPVIYYRATIFCITGLVYAATRLLHAVTGLLCVMLQGYYILYYRDTI